MANLQDMTLDELWQLFPVVLKEYKPSYPLWYEEERLWLADNLSEYGVCRINHIGSTSVGGLAGKPTVDILLEFERDYDTDGVQAILDAVGWMLMSESGTARRASYCKGYTPEGLAEKSFHLHVRPFGDWDELYFRDYLRAHKDAAAEYEALKYQLQRRFEHDRDAYTEAKTSFTCRCAEEARKEFPGRYE